MRRVETNALVGASREAVWALYDDLAGTPRWVPAVRDVRSVSGPARVGAMYREHRRVAGIPSLVMWEIIQHRPLTRQVRRSVGGSLETTRIITFEGRGTGTWITQAEELRSRLPWPIGWLHELLATIPAGWSVRSTVAGAKQVFEGASSR